MPQPLSARLPAAERDALVALANPRLVFGVAEGTYAGRACLPEGFEADAALSDAPLPDRVSPHGQAIASGGSTGRPKLIVDANPAKLRPRIGALRQSRRATSCLVPGPLFHTGPFLNAREALLRGASVVLMARFDAQQFLELVARHRVAWVNVVPTMLHRIWQLPEAVKARRRSLLAAARGDERRALRAVADARVDRLARPRPRVRGLRRHRAHRRHADLGARVARAPGLRRQADRRAQDPHPRSGGPRAAARRDRRGLHAAARRPGLDLSLRRRRVARHAPTAGSRSATWATSTPTASSIWSTAAPT